MSNISSNQDWVKKYRVALLTSSYSYGGGEAVSRSLLNISDERIETKLITVNESVAYLSQPDAPISLGAKLPEITGIKYYLFRVASLIRACVRYHKYLVENNVSVSIDVGAFTSIVNLIACIGTKTKSVSTKHTIYILTPETENNWGHVPSTLYKWFYCHWVYKHADIVIAVSDGVTDSLLANNIDKNKVIRIYNPLDILNIQQKAEENIELDFFTGNEPIIITVGRLEEIKGQWHLIRVFREVRKKVSCKLVICGDGTYKEYLMSLVSKWNLDNDVIFTGHVANPYKYYSKATVFVCTSISEALPYALLEAMACSCPVLSSENPGANEICGKSEYGLLSLSLSLEKYDEQYELDGAERELMEKLFQLLTDATLRDKYIAAGLKRVEDFRKEKAYDAYRSLIYSLLGDE